MTSETYLASAAYRELVSSLTCILRQGGRSLYNERPMLPDELRTHLHVTLGFSGVFVGSDMMLVEALAGLEPDAFTGEYEPCAVKLTLGEEGDVWPSWMLEEPTASACTMQLSH